MDKAVIRKYAMIERIRVREPGKEEENNRENSFFAAA